MVMMLEAVPPEEVKQQDQPSNRSPISDNGNNNDRKPLSWLQARTQFQKILKEYLDQDDGNKKNRKNIHLHDDRRDQSHEERDGTSLGGISERVSSILAKCVEKDIDIYIGPAFLSLLLLVFQSIALYQRRHSPSSSSWLGVTRNDDDDKENETSSMQSVPFYRSQLAASVLLFLGSCLSLWIVRRRKVLDLAGREHVKKREVFTFLKEMEMCNEDTILAEDPNQRRLNDPHFLEAQVSVPGNSLSGVYPVYRIRDDASEGSGTVIGSWYRIPALLLVQGDIIALQVGDIPPADCTSLDSTISLKKGHQTVVGSFHETTDSIAAEFPKGRTTIDGASSESLLSFCNRTRLFSLDASPVLDFLDQTIDDSRQSRLCRQILCIRKLLFALLLVMLVLASTATFSRTEVFDGDLSQVISIPILASFSLIPGMAPWLTFFIETIGNARILCVVHFLSSRDEDKRERASFRGFLLVRYMFATMISRLSLARIFQRATRVINQAYPKLTSRIWLGATTNLVRVPPASMNLLENLGVATAFALVDDELACENHSVPQQLLVPSREGLKLLDLCPVYDEDDDDSGTKDSIAPRKRRGSFESESDSDEENSVAFLGLKRKVLRRRTVKRKRIRRREEEEEENSTASDDSTDSYEVQFEDPLWWHYLPSLKCIGLSSMIVDRVESNPQQTPGVSIELRQGSDTDLKSSLIQQICRERKNRHLRLLAECIGFNTTPNSFGPKGDLTPFQEENRFHILSTRLMKQRLLIDAHERSSEQSRWWGLVRPDSTSVIVRDSRSNSNQLLTVGDPDVVLSLCNEAWQGEASTILPLTLKDRQTIADTSRDWKLGDLDVVAFSYAPLPHTFKPNKSCPVQYLLDNGSTANVLKDKNLSKEWTLVRNQIFLGLLGSLVVPRPEIHLLLRVLNDAGVRFVYFSPRNMRRQKELASQMGIDVAWNCAISLRPLGSGEIDPHRMVSTYGDWDTNAKLPHGIANVRTHLEEVDNVPLLVSLFTDVTKGTTREMVEIFQVYHDTVIAVGLAHDPRNDQIFRAADISISIDTLTESLGERTVVESHRSPFAISPELEFVSRLSSHACAFRFKGISAILKVPTLIEEGRAAYLSVISAGLYVLVSCLSLSLYILFSVCTPSTNIPHVPILGVFLYLQILLPILGCALSLTKGDDEIMEHVPPKNDASVFIRGEGHRLYVSLFIRACLPALLPQILHMIVFGEIVIHSDPDVANSSCPGSETWMDLVRCTNLRGYSGTARESSGVLVFSIFALCNLCMSMSFVRRFFNIWDSPPFASNWIWTLVLLVCIAITVCYAVVTTDDDTIDALPWYFYIIVFLAVVICILGSELTKWNEIKFESRSEKFRRLQFETRLGAWSPK